MLVCEIVTQQRLLGIWISRGCCLSAGVLYRVITYERIYMLQCFLLKVYCHFFFSEACACDICDRSRLPSRWLSSHGDYSPTAPAALSLRPFVPSGSLIRCQSVQVYHHHPSFPIGACKTFESGQCSYISGSYSVCSLFFRFGRGRPLHNVLTFTFRSLMEVPTICFATSNS
jgi:hypothetical protein